MNQKPKKFTQVGKVANMACLFFLDYCAVTFLVTMSIYSYAVLLAFFSPVSIKDGHKIFVPTVSLLLTLEMTRRGKSIFKDNESH